MQFPTLDWSLLQGELCVVLAALCPMSTVTVDIHHTCNKSLWSNSNITKSLYLLNLSALHVIIHVSAVCMCMNAVYLYVHMHVPICECEWRGQRARC